MKNLIIIVLTTLIFSVSAEAQKIFTKEGAIAFYSKAPMEDIEAHNNKATAVIDTESGILQWAVLIKGFQFEKALMQEHFNENYMESDQYPKAQFKGKFTDANAINWDTDGEYNAEVTGDLSIHGVTKNITAPAVIIIKDGKVSGTSEFKVKVADYNIEIPSVVRENIAKEIKITIAADFEELEG